MEVKWMEDGTGVQPGGDVGGDAQDGQSWSRRFVHPDVPGALINVYVYASHDNPSRPGLEWSAALQVEYMLCTDTADPGGTEVWADYLYRTLRMGYPSRAYAETAARRVLEEFPAASEAAKVYMGWGGEQHAAGPGSFAEVLDNSRTLVW